MKIGTIVAVGFLCTASAAMAQTGAGMDLLRA
jgi:hypothetical protein